MHKKFQAQRTKGEWFVYAQEIQKFIQALIKKDRELDRDQDLKDN